MRAILTVRDEDPKDRLPAVGRQTSRHMVDAPATLVWLIDFSPARFLADKENQNATTEGTPPPPMPATV